MAQETGLLLSANRRNSMWADRSETREIYQLALSVKASHTIRHLV